MHKAQAAVGELLVSDILHDVVGTTMNGRSVNARSVVTHVVDHLTPGGLEF